MTEDGWRKGWEKLTGYFQPPRGKQDRDEREQLYHDRLDSLSDARFMVAVLECIDTLPQKTFPSIAEVRACAGMAPDSAKTAAGEFHQASPAFRAGYERQFKRPIVTVSEEDLRRGVAADGLRQKWESAEQERLTEAVARDYPWVEGLHVLDQIERIAVLAGLMKPIRLASWTLAEIKAGVRVGPASPVAGDPSTEQAEG